MEEEKEIKKISKLTIRYTDGRPDEDAKIYIPISQVEGLDTTLSWMVFPSSTDESSSEKN